MKKKNDKVVHNLFQVFHMFEMYKSLQMTSTFPASGSTDEVGQPPSISSDDVHRPPTSSYNLIEIQKIKEDLMSDFDTQVAPAVTGPGPLPPYTAVAVRRCYLLVELIEQFNIFCLSVCVSLYLSNSVYR